MTEQMPCPICSTVMINRKRNYFRCDHCKYQLSTEHPGAGAEVEGVEDVRIRNFDEICTILKTNFNVKTIVEVGCARGLFLKTAQQHGFIAEGIEPDAELSKEARQAGLAVYTNFFPNCNALSSKTYDAIIFNDSFEHIPNLEAIIGGIKSMLNPGGIAIVNIPTTDGLMYLISSILDKAGFPACLDRLWQKGFASPHLHYFNNRNLKRLFETNGFSEQYRRKLIYYTINGLWRRLRSKSGVLLSIATWAFLATAYPLFRYKSDCFAGFYKKL